jgi:hypothetical protein
MVCRQMIRARLGPSRVLTTDVILDVGARSRLFLSHLRDARGVRRFHLVTLLQDDEPTDWLGWPRPLSHSIQDQRQARQGCEANRHEFHRAFEGQDRPNPAIPTNARFR